MLATPLAVSHVLVLVLQHERQPVLLLLLVLADDGEALLLRVERDGVLVAAVRLAVDVEAGVQVDGALGKLAQVELFLRVVVLQAGGPTAAGGAEHEVLFLHRLE